MATEEEKPLPIATNGAMFPVPLAGKPTEVAVFIQLYVVPVTEPANMIAFVVDPLHNIWSCGCTTSGVGFTVTVNASGIPEQPDAEGVTVIVALTGAMVELTALNGAIFPVPLAGKPMDVLLLVHAYVVPLNVLVKVIALVVALLHKVWLGGGTTLGVGFTVIINVLGAPGQPPADGVTVIVAVTGVLVELTALNGAIFPVPFAGKPIDVLLLVQV